MIHARYLSALAFGAGLWLGLFFAVTLAIDPYGVSPVRISLPLVNQFKPKRLDIDRLLKPYEVWRRQPRTVFLGTSRVHQAIDPATLDGSRFAPAYNASIPANSLRLNLAHLQQYVELDSALRTVVVELFLYNFLGQPQEDPPENRFEYLLNTAALFASADVLWASVQTLAYNLIKNAPHAEITPRGNYSYAPGHNPEGLFNQFPAGIWKLHQARGEMGLHEPAFESLREILRVARERNLEVMLVLTPNHAYDELYIESIGAWDMVEKWLSKMTELDHVYSFSQPNTWVYEPARNGMRYWYDPYHFSQEMGRAMQLALAGVTPDDVPDNFMIRLTPDTVRGHIESRRGAIRRWARQNPDFVARVDQERRKWAAALSMKKKP